jgi:hypothetical protein
MRKWACLVLRGSRGTGKSLFDFVLFLSKEAGDAGHLSYDEVVFGETTRRDIVEAEKKS